MLDTALGRVGAITVLLAVLVGLMLGFGMVTATPNPAQGSYPAHGHLVVDYGQYVGDRVEVAGTVVRTDPVIIENDYSTWVGDRYRTGTVRIRITGLDRSVRPGQDLWVFGVAGPDGAVRATNTVVVPAGRIVYTYLVSAVAGLWVLARLIRGWRLDRSTLAFHRRETPLTREEFVAVLLGNEVDTDA